MSDGAADIRQPRQYRQEWRSGSLSDDGGADPAVALRHARTAFHVAAKRHGAGNGRCDVLQWVAANHIVLERRMAHCSARGAGSQSRRNALAAAEPADPARRRRTARSRGYTAAWISASASMSTATCTSIRAGRRRMRKTIQIDGRIMRVLRTKNMCACPPGAGHGQPLLGWCGGSTGLALRQRFTPECSRWSWSCLKAYS